LTWNLHGTHAQENDLVELVGLSHKHFIILLKPGGELHTHRGVVYHNDLIGTAWGSQIHSHSGSPFFMLQPALNDLLRSVPRRTQIMYPKEIGYILVALGIGPGQHVIEAGTGSGALTTALAYAVGTTGKVISYEARPEMQEVARKNLERFGLSDRVDFKIRDIGDGFDETGVDSLFLDVANSYDYMHQVRGALKPGGFFGSILPTTNQVTKLLYALRHEDFAFTEVLEIMLRFYKPEPDKLRPTDRMIAHTGFLIFARPVIIDHTQESESPLIEEEWEADNDL
jgi:tRNA (adenine57-N1/adenine58-N1)-methyltransferase catalytic subunit